MLFAYFDNWLTVFADFTTGAILFLCHKFVLLRTD